ncbi:olfactory receptor 10J5-like [Discoglossus pictus]
MSLENHTVVPGFFILGFPDINNYNILIFLIFLLTLILTLSGNLLIVSVVFMSHYLKSPMYFFLLHLSISDLLLTTNIVPNMLYVILWDGGHISIFGCITQFYLLGCSGITECLVLTVMSYDRYLAICNPLRYTSIMNSVFCHLLVTCCWSLGSSLMLITVTLVSRLQFCGQIIDYLFCDLAPLLELSCSDTSVVQMVNFLLAIPVTIFPFGFIIITYIYISITILRISSSIGRQKAFSTCSSHLTVVFMYYGSLVTIYVFPSRVNSTNVNKSLSLLYTVVTPFMNPLIYSLRNQEIRVAIKLFILTNSKVDYSKIFGDLH